jgi:hypothetical protein
LPVRTVRRGSAAAHPELVAAVLMAATTQEKTRWTSHPKISSGTCEALSGVVSKYIGETEKNLDRIFAK